MGENVFAQIIDKHVNEFMSTLKEAISNDIRNLLMGGPSKQAKAPTPRVERKTRKTVDNETINAVIYQVTQHNDGAGTSTLSRELGVDKNFTAKALKAALKTGKIRKTGDKRSTMYFANEAVAAE